MPPDSSAISHTSGDASAARLCPVPAWGARRGWGAVRGGAKRVDGGARRLPREDRPSTPLGLTHAPASTSSVLGRRL
jgi:hypothetical protein